MFGVVTVLVLGTGCVVLHEGANDAGGLDRGEVSADAAATDSASTGDDAWRPDTSTGADSSVRTDANVGADTRPGTDASVGVDTRPSADASGGRDASAGHDVGTGTDANATRDASAGADGSVTTCDQGSLLCDGTCAICPVQYVVSTKCRADLCVPESCEPDNAITDLYDADTSSYIRDAACGAWRAHAPYVGSEYTGAMVNTSDLRSVYAYIDSTQNSSVFVVREEPYGMGTHMVTYRVDTVQSASPSLAVDASDTPVVAYQATAQSNLRVGRLQSTGQFTHVEVDAVGSVGWKPSLALDSQGLARVSYFDNTNGRLKFAWEVSLGTWQTISLLAAGDMAQAQLAIDSNDLAWIAHVDFDNPVLHLGSVDGEGHHVAAPDLALGPAVSINFTLAIAPDGAILVAFADVDGQSIWFARYSGEWSASEITILESWDDLGVGRMGFDFYGRPVVPIRRIRYHPSSSEISYTDVLTARLIDGRFELSRLWFTYVRLAGGLRVLPATADGRIRIRVLDGIYSYIYSI